MVRLVIKRRKRRNALKMCPQADFAFSHRNCRNQRFSEKSIRKWFWGRRMFPAAGLGGWGSFSPILLDSRPVLLDFSSILSSLLMSSSILLGPTPRFSWVAPRFSSILLDSLGPLLDSPRFPWLLKQIPRRIPAIDWNQRENSDFQEILMKLAQNSEMPGPSPFYGKRRVRIFKHSRGT